jgi:hypothetical protein
MDFEMLTMPQQIALHELELHDLRMQGRHQDTLLLGLLDLLSLPAGSGDFAQTLRKLTAEGDVIRKRMEQD